MEGARGFLPNGLYRAFAVYPHRGAKVPGADTRREGSGWAGFPTPITGGSRKCRQCRAEGTMAR